MVCKRKIVENDGAFLLCERPDQELNRVASTLFGLLQKGYSRHTLWAGKEIVMDTTTYASVAMLPERIARDHKHSVRQDQELLPLDLSMIKR